MKKQLMIKRDDFEALLRMTASPEERKLIRLAARVWDGDDRVKFVLGFLRQVYRKEEIMQYLVREKLTGTRLWEFVQGECAGSCLMLTSYVLKRLNRDKELKPIIAGKDLPA